MTTPGGARVEKVPVDGDQCLAGPDLRTVVVKDGVAEGRARPLMPEAGSRPSVDDLGDNIFNLRQFLSGRTLYTGGTLSSIRFPSSNFNCASLVIKDIESFHDMFYLLMLGCGVGFRILEDDIKNLPKFRTDVKVTHLPYLEEEYKFEETDLSHNGNISKIVIGDSKSGWTKALEYLLTMLTCETIEEIIIDYNNVRPKGSRLKTFGGTASGHEAIDTLFRKICNIPGRHPGWERL